MRHHRHPHAFTLALAVTLAAAATSPASADPTPGGTDAVNHAPTPTVKTHGQPGPNDKYSCQAVGWLIGTRATNGELLAYKITNPTSHKAAISAPITISEKANFAKYVVRGSSNNRLYAWDDKNNLFTFTWNVSGKINGMSKPLPVPAGMTFDSNRQLRTVDEAGNMYHINAEGDLIRSTITLGNSGEPIIASTGEVIARRAGSTTGPQNLPGSPRALWASGDGVIQVLVDYTKPDSKPDVKAGAKKDSKSFAMKIDLATHRLVTPFPDFTKGTIDRGNEYYVGSLGGSVDYSLARADSTLFRYRMDPASTSPANTWPEKVDETVVKRDEFGTLGNLTGLMDGCTRSDLHDAVIDKPIGWNPSAQSTFVQAQNDIVAGFKFRGNSAGWGKSRLSDHSSTNKIDQVQLPESIAPRPPIALTPAGPTARLFVHTTDGTVVTALANDTTANPDTATFSAMGGAFLAAPTAVKLSATMSMLIGVAANGDVWYSEVNGDTYTAWTIVAGVKLSPTAKVTLDAATPTSARFFSLAGGNQLMTGIINLGGTLTGLTGFARLPGEETMREGVGVSYADRTYHLVVASTTGTIYHLKQTPTGWPSAWTPVGPAGYTPGIPGIVDDTIAGRTFIFTRNQDNKLSLISESIDVPGTFNAPTPVGTMSKVSLVDDPIMKTITVGAQRTFGTVVRSTLGETWLLYAKYGANPDPGTTTPNVFTTRRIATDD